MTQVEPITTDDRAPRRRSAARTTQVIIAAVGVFALLLTGLYAVVSWPRPPETGPVADLPARGMPWLPFDNQSADDMLWQGINDAMRAKDRDAFLSYASGEAVDQLAQWWDNTTEIGWDTATMTPRWRDSQDETKAQVVLGAQFAFAARPLRGSGNRDADLQLLQGLPYSVTLTPTPERGRSFDQYNDDGSLEEQEPVEARKITSLVPAYTPNPWDEGALHVVRRDHVVLFGMADEAALVEATADEAEASAVIALEAIRSLGGEVPQQGFVAAITDDAERFGRWEFGEGERWDFDIAGYARPTIRPVQVEPWLDARVATGTDTSGTIVAMGPLSATQRRQTFVHEFAHALHFTAAPGGVDEPPRAVMEGFARFIEWDAGLSEPRYTSDAVRQAVADRGAGAFDDESLTSEGAGIAYQAAGSYYAFAAEKGYSPWGIALDARTGYAGLVGYSELHDDISIPAWQQWLAAQ